MRIMIQLQGHHKGLVQSLYKDLTHKDTEQIINPL